MLGSPSSATNAIGVCSTRRHSGFHNSDRAGCSSRFRRTARGSLSGPKGQAKLQLSARLFVTWLERADGPAPEHGHRRAAAVAPTVVGGSKKHGGPDLGPTRAKREWAALGVDGHGIADAPPAPEFPLDGRPRLTVEMVARLQGFPSDWAFQGRKTARYRQVGNAFPPPVAQAVGQAIRKVLEGEPQTPRGLAREAAPLQVVAGD